MPATSSRGHGDKEGRPEVPLGWRQERGGEDTPSEPKSSEEEDQLTTTVPPHASISCLMVVKSRVCVDGTYSLVRDFAGPIVFTGHRGCHGHDGKAGLIESRGNGALPKKA
jgi:hypothetical protein